jgi:choline kinase
VSGGRANLPHEEAVRDLFLERSHTIEIGDVTGSPWIEIDFTEDIERATREILPRLQALVA